MKYWIALMSKNYLIRFYCILLSSIGLAPLAISQEKKDSVEAPKQSSGSVFSVMFKGKPGKALTYSLLLPGAGQVYNKKYWKLPIVYAGLGSMIYFIQFNSKEFNRYDKALRERVDHPMDPQDEFVGVLSVSGIDSYRKFYDRNLQLSYIGLGIVYLLTGIDAYVDAHLSEFDVSEDLSIQLNPEFSGSGGQIVLQLRF
ncbi:MAG: hypothetical protein IPM34_08620 [Saprospiraceae bacterium]|nr:hypothetical protein [Saprospiraceae bacterium]